MAAAGCDGALVGEGPQGAGDPGGDVAPQQAGGDRRVGPHGVDQRVQVGVDHRFAPCLRLLVDGRVPAGRVRQGEPEPAVRGEGVVDLVRAGVEEDVVA